MRLTSENCNDGSSLKPFKLSYGLLVIKTIPFWTSVPQRMFTSISALYKCFVLTISV